MQKEDTWQFLGTKATVEEQKQELKSGIDIVFKVGQFNPESFFHKSQVKKQAPKSVFLRATEV